MIVNAHSFVVKMEMEMGAAKMGTEMEVVKMEMEMEVELQTSFPCFREN